VALAVEALFLPMLSLLEHEAAFSYSRFAPAHWALRTVAQPAP